MSRSQTLALRGRQLLKRFGQREFEAKLGPISPTPTIATR